MNTKTVLACTAVVIAFALFVAPIAISEDASARQQIKQSSKISQSSSVTSGLTTTNSGNNFAGSFNLNFGSNIR